MTRNRNAVGTWNWVTRKNLLESHFEKAMRQPTLDETRQILDAAQLIAQIEPDRLVSLAVQMEVERWVETQRGLRELLKEIDDAAQP